MKIRLLLALVLAAVLAGCGTQPPATPPTGTTVDQSPTVAPSTPEMPKQGPHDPGAFAFTVGGGGTGVLQLPAAVVPEIEALRQLVGGDPVAYVTAAVDNREGTDLINMYEVQVFNPEGRQFTYSSAGEYVDSLRQKLPADVPAETYNRFIDLSNAYLDDAAPLEVKDFVLVGEPVPDKITGVTVYATGGFNPVPASPVK